MSLAFTVVSVIYVCYIQLYKLHKRRRYSESSNRCACLCVCVCVCRCACRCLSQCVCVCTWVWKFQFDFLPKTWYLISVLNMWMSEITICISTFLLAEESIFGTNKLHFSQALQWPWVKVAISHRIGSTWISPSIWF